LDKRAVKRNDRVFASTKLNADYNSESWTTTEKFVREGRKEMETSLGATVVKLMLG
jgi:hypothetical protein